jgi:hypothetical protein
MSKGRRLAVVMALLFSIVASHGESIRVELLVVQVPQVSGLKMRSRLKDEKTVGLAVDELKEMVLAGSATLVDALISWGKGGERSVSESLEEIRYQTEFNPPGCFVFSAPFPPPVPEQDDLMIDSYAKIGVPTAFETRNVGVTLECEATVASNGKTIHITFVITHVTYHGMRSSPLFNKTNWQYAQPIFHSIKTTTALSVASGVWNLISVNTIRGEKPAVEFSLIRAITFPDGR